MAYSTELTEPTLKPYAVTGLDFLSVSEIVKRTTLSKNYVLGLIRSGELPSRRFGRRVLIPAAEAQRFFGG